MTEITEDKSSQFQWIALLAILVIVLVFYIITIREGQDWAGDFSQYIDHATNLVKGKPYNDIGYIYNPDYPELGPRSYPIGFPLLLTPVIALFGLNLWAMKVELISIFVCSLLLFFLVLRQRAEKYPVLQVGLVAFSPYFWDFKDQVRSDIPFLLWVMLCIYLLMHLKQLDASSHGP